MPAIVIKERSGRFEPAANPRDQRDPTLARAEAERLARENPGQAFGVWVRVGVALKHDVEWKPDPEDVPF
ncbi:MAG: hypothetical protein WC789_10440 [Lentisphaeria bacterium]